uniref:Ubiquitin-like domain-containing protein n=1 Tax=Amphora coffeiformis TaxID=265554 RepID=A0A7S3PDL0_9STRA|mmetsp:Transcript_3727/g.7412  ORF Transcript_3727/g.7412 Transcript_3727/m.7412 type:complete len:398 (+) Transcript_3727:257-1450(+)
MDPLLLPKQGVKTLSDDEEDGVEDIPLKDEETWNLRVKSLKDVSILVRPRDTVKAVKDAVRQALGPDLTRDRPYTRLVCKGRLLAPDAALLKDLSVVQPDDVVHAVLSASAPREGPQAALQRGVSDTSGAEASTPVSAPSRTSSRRNSNHQENPGSASSGPSRRAWRGAGINAAGIAVRQTAADSDGEDDDDEDSVEDVENGGWMGFDRLRRAGLSRSDVVTMRVYFGRSIDRFIRQNPEQTTFANETDPRRRRLLQEELWMAAQGPLSEFRLNINPMTSASGAPPSWVAGGSASGWNNTTTARGGVSPSEALWRSGGLSAAVGTDRDFIWGFLLGFLVGLLMLVWVWMPSVPHKQKLGILTGISFQLALTMLRTSGDVEDNNQYLVHEGDDLFLQD